MPRQHLSSVCVPRSPYSPLVKTWSPAGRERGLALLRHPSHTTSSASTRTTEYQTSESTLCETQKRPGEILEISPKTKTISPLYSPTLELASGAHCRRSRVFDYSPLLYAYYDHHSLSASPMLTSRPVSLHIPLSPGRGPLCSPTTVQRLSQPSHDHGSSREGGMRGSASRAQENAAGADESVRQTMDDILVFPPSRHSARLRRLAPPPLRLSPLSHSALQRRRSSVPEPEPLLSPFVEIPLVTAACLSPTNAQSPGPRRSVIAIDLPEDISSTSFSSLEILQWRRRVSRVFDSSLPPLSQEQSVGEADTILPEQAPPAPLPAQPSPQTSSSGQSHYTHFDQPPAYSASIDTSVSRSPPPLGRTYPMALPPIPYAYSSREGEALLSPLIPDLRTALAVPSLITRAKRCAEAAGDAAMSLTSCSLLREPEAILNLCKVVQQTLHAVQQELDSTPDVRNAQESEELQTWHQKHWQLVSSLERNLNIFYLFADQLRARPPRIHRLAGHLDKLHAFRDKFADIAWRLALSHQKLELVGLRAQFLKEHRAARAQADSERKRRGEFRAVWSEGRVQRQALREEIRRSKVVADHIRKSWVTDRGL